MVIFISACITISELLTMALVPDTIARVDLHNIRTKEYDDIFVGTSHGLNAINPEIVDQQTGRKSTNLCLPNEFLVDSYYLIKEAGRKNKPSRVIYQLDSSYWCTAENVGENAVYIYNQYPASSVKMDYFNAKIMKLDFRTVLTPWIYYRNCYGSAIQSMEKKMTRDYKNYGVNALNNDQSHFTKEGFVYQNSLEVTGEPDIVYWDESKLQEKEIDYFDKMVRYCKMEGIELIMISTPVPSVTRTKYQEQFAKADIYFSDLAKTYDIEYYNFDQLTEREFDKGIDGYVDFEGHMSGENGNRFSEILGNYLK